MRTGFAALLVKLRESASSSGDLALVSQNLDQAVFELSFEPKGFDALRNTVASVSEPFV